MYSYLKPSSLSWIYSLFPWVNLAFTHQKSAWPQIKMQVWSQSQSKYLFKSHAVGIFSLPPPPSFLVYLCSYFNQWVILSTGKCRQWFLTQFLIQKLRSTDSPLKDICYRKASPYYPALFFSPWTGVQSHWNKSLDWACNCVKKQCNVDLSISLLMATLPRLFERNKICLAF